MIAFDHSVPIVILQILLVNSPDLVLFVGDALAGNEASDQLSKFNKVSNGVSQFCYGCDGADA
jgi:hypothetical protein